MLILYLHICLPEQSFSGIALFFKLKEKFFMKIKISADSVIDLSPQMIAENDIAIVPLFVTLGGTSYIDGVDVTPDDIYAFVSKTGQLPKTAAVSEEAYRGVFKKYTDEGYAIIHFNISAEMSASHQNAKAAAEGMNNVYVIDSRNLSSGVGLLVLHACDLIKEGLDAKTIAEKVQRRIPFVQASFIIDKLDYLHKGGRCSSITLLGANLLSIKPTIEVKNGKMVVGKKYIGSLKRAIDKYVPDMLANFRDYDKKRIFITHTKIAPEIIERVRELICKYAEFEEILETTAGGTITSHCGPGTLGILYINDRGAM